ncbi:MAG: putative lipoprotein [Rhodocyclales bacterium]|nr:putative lipoprotein [Rhodocyclales bacterium]
MVSGWINGNPPRTAIRKVTVIADAQSNQGAGSALDLVFVYDVAAVTQLPKTGPEWFTQKAALQAALATSIDVVPLQVPAVASNFSVKLPDRASKAIGVYALANYIGEDGQPIANLTPWREVTIRLMPMTINYSGT